MVYLGGVCLAMPSAAIRNTTVALMEGPGTLIIEWPLSGILTSGRQMVFTLCLQSSHIISECTTTSCAVSTYQYVRGDRQFFVEYIQHAEMTLSPLIPEEQACCFSERP